MKSGAPTTAVTGATASFARSDDRAGESIAKTNGDGSTSRGSRNKVAMVRAEDETASHAARSSLRSNGAADGDGQTGQE